MDEAELRAAGDRIEGLLGALERTLDARAWEQVQDVIRLVTELHGSGLARILELAGDDDLASRMAEDDLLASLLVIHGLHPLSLEERVRQAIDSVRPYLASHAGGVEILDVDADSGAVALRLLGSCDGCPSSSITLEQAVRQAIDAAAPEIRRVDVHGVEPSGGSETPIELGRKPDRGSAHAVGSCDLCGAPVADVHDHVADLEQRSLRCTCRACSLLFTGDGAGGGKLRTVPDRYRSLDGWSISAGAWDELQVPVSVAFFLRDSASGTITAFYPSPAGATESLLPLDAWDRLLGGDDARDVLEPDVEALLVRRDERRQEAYLVPIDACYELVGELRKTWKGFDGGDDARRTIDGFFTRVRERSS